MIPDLELADFLKKDVGGKVGSDSQNLVGRKYVLMTEVTSSVERNKEVKKELPSHRKFQNNRYRSKTKKRSCSKQISYTWKNVV